MPERVTHVTFLGSASALPSAEEDSASFVVNRVLLVDAPCGVVRGLLRCGLDPMGLKAVVFTHFHQDHYMGLPQLLFYRGLRGSWQGNPGPLALYGPSDLPRVVQLAHDFLRAQEFPPVWPQVECLTLQPGDEVDACGIRLSAGAGAHAVEDLCYRAVDQATGASVAFTGDTLYHEPIAELAHRADLLIHEASLGADAPPEVLRQTMHSSAADAARIAALAEAKQLVLIHYETARAQERLAEARAIFPDTILAKGGLTLSLHGS
ncbi:MAG: MBL fold metallo-hydrolase [Armatimonadota bacterium]